MLMTMEEEYKRETELMPSPERLEKVIRKTFCHKVQDQCRIYSLTSSSKYSDKYTLKIICLLDHSV